MTRARIELSRALAALGRDEDAQREAVAALEAARSFGAAGLARRAEAVLQRGERAGRGKVAAIERSDLTRLTPPELTERQLEVLRLVAQGMTNRQIAARLVLSDHTIHRHLANIYTRLGVASRTAAAAFAVREELI